MCICAICGVGLFQPWIKVEGSSKRVRNQKHLSWFWIANCEEEDPSLCSVLCFLGNHKASRHGRRRTFIFNQRRTAAASPESPASIWPGCWGGSSCWRIWFKVSSGNEDFFEKNDHRWDRTEPFYFHPVLNVMLSLMAWYLCETLETRFLFKIFISL